MFTFKIRSSTKSILKVFLIGMQGYYQGRNIPSTEAARLAGVTPSSLSYGYQRLLLAGLVTSRTGGENPGYMISRDPKEITLLEVLKALENFPRVRCSHSEILNGGYCVLCDAINGMIIKLEEEFSKITLYEYYLSLEDGKDLLDI